MGSQPRASLTDKKAAKKPTRHHGNRRVGQASRPLNDKSREVIEANAFKPGRKKTGGRKLGTLNHIPKQIKEAVMTGACLAGYFKDDDNPYFERWDGGVDGYFTCLCIYQPDLAVKLMALMLPIELTGKNGGPVQLVYQTREEVRQRMKELGMPIPAPLSELPKYAQHPNAVQADHPTQQ